MREESGQLEIILDDAIVPRLLGEGDANLQFIEKHFESQLTVRGSRIVVRGPEPERERIRRVFADLESLFLSRNDVTMKDIRTILNLSGFSGGSGNGAGSSPSDGSVVFESPRGPVKCRGANQERYVRLMEQKAIVFGLGPAGTGKTYLAVAKAVDWYHRRLVDKIILVRPVVETGETLGYLPGDILEKVDPYFRPLYDALDDMLTHERVRRFIDRGAIEVAPLAYMRGRTLSHAFVILDEAQNTTSGQMKMFLTRLGVSSRAVLTGDLTQIDLPDPSKSGLFEARQILSEIEGIGFIEFTDQDVVRHPLVAEILRAYQNGGNDKSSG
jgi:phosphate starvation-inducible PhoH-like protein